MFKNNFIRLNYLLKCDLINKYLLEDTYSYPKIKLINLEISLKNLLIDKNLNFKIRIFIIVFLLNFNFPFIKCLNVLKNNKINSILNATDFKLLLNFNKKKTINDFLICLFIENYRLDNLYKINNIFSSIDQNSKIRIFAPLISLFNFSYLLNSPVFSIDLKESFIFIDIVLKNKNLKNKEYLLKNLEFFWLI